MSNYFTLSELDELSENLGHEIFLLLENHSTFSRFKEVEEEVRKLLREQGLSPENILVDRGLSDGMTIAGAFKKASRFYQHQDQFGAYYSQ